jgi:hypothetical protein
VTAVTVIAHHLPVVLAAGIASVVALLALQRDGAAEGPIVIGLFLIYLLLGLSRDDTGRRQPARRGARRG